MLCGLSGQVVKSAVVCTKTGLLFEESLIRKALAESDGVCPITGEEHLSMDADFLPIKQPKTPHQITTSTTSSTSIPGMLGKMQNEWDDLMLEMFTLKKHLATTRQELSQALYQQDAACRVIARLNETIASQETRINELLTSKDSEAATEEQEDKGKIPAGVLYQIETTAKRLSTERKANKKKKNDAKPAERQWQCTSTWQLHKTTKPKINRIRLMSQNPDLIVTAGSDGEANVFSLSSGQVCTTLVAEKSASKMKVVDVVTRENLVVTGGSDGRLRTYAPVQQSDWAAGNKALTSLQPHSHSLEAIALHPTGDFIGSVSGSDSSWAFSDLRESKVVYVHDKDSTSQSLHTIQFHPDGAIFATGASQKNSLVQIWDLKSQSNVANLTVEGLEGSLPQTTSVSFSENGYHLVSGSGDLLVFWDLRKLTHFCQLKIEETLSEPKKKKTKSSSKQSKACAKVNDVMYDFSGNFVGVATDVGVQIVCETGKKKMSIIQEWGESDSPVSSVAMAPNAEFFVSAQHNRAVKLYR